MFRWTSLTALVAAGALAACDRPGGPAGPSETLDRRDSFAASTATAPLNDAIARVLPTLGTTATSSLGPVLRTLITAVERADVSAVQRASAAAAAALAKYDSETQRRHAAEVEVIHLAVNAALTGN